ncbi:DUF4307 domain-containing protein [Ruania zhangjianzhongii]|uniref:DUF4307 domain-containing protein n=1 Tax=Ruania zhangjianzhongii TaxID=2603206 RepID=UPI0011CB1C75|nr:DUF4307 domain-containing protein [Ruania zhangjianzhongii]
MESQAPGTAQDAPSAAQAERTAQVMAERYGSRPPVRRRKRALWLTAGSLGTIGIATLVWISVQFFDPDATSEQVGFDVVDDTQVQVIVDVSKPNEATATCTLEALNEGYGQVGITDITIGPQDQRTTRLTVDIATTELATTGVVRECSLVD